MQEKDFASIGHFDPHITYNAVTRTVPKYASRPQTERLTTTSGKPFKTMATRKLPDGWAVIEVERVHQEGFFERVVGRGYASEQVAEVMVKVLTGVVDSG